MKFLNLFLFTTLFSRANTSVMPTKRICKDCRHFIANDLQCRKFGHADIVTGKLTYEYARSMQETFCYAKVIRIRAPSLSI